MIKIYVVSHKNVFIPNTPLISVLNPDILTGSHISNKNEYSELRAHYWVWKNADRVDSHIALFQFRRYLEMTATPFIDFTAVHRPTPYTIRHYPQKPDIAACSSLDSFDVVAPLLEYTGITVWERYASSEGHRLLDLQLVYSILIKKHPDYQIDCDTYLCGRGEYFGNLYIMRWEAFDTYCDWLFPLLDEYDAQAKNVPPRTQGYLAERLFGIWFLHLLRKRDFRCAEIPRVHFWGYDDHTHHLRREMVLNSFLPPGTKLRAAVRRFVKPSGKG